MPTIISDQIQVQSEAVDEKGHKLEPEAQPARRVMGIETAAACGGQIVGAFNSALAFHDDAMQFARNAMSQCKLCKHFDHDAWTALRLSWEHGTMEKRRDLNKMRAALLETDNAEIQSSHADPIDGDMDVEASLNSMGVCMVQTEVYNEPVITHPMGGCSETPGPNGEDLSMCFEPRHVEAERKSTQIYDTIMRMAQGRAPGGGKR